MGIELERVSIDHTLQKSVEKTFDKKLVPEQSEKPVDAQKQEESKLDQSIQVADGLDTLAEAFNKGIRFQVHEDLDRVYVEIVDRSTGEVIKQIPPEDMLKIAAKFQEFIGLIFDEKV
ncbi:MAG: flagellar protein FlaG [Firmicutes bacterium]|jgi:flagellar protein FlaG|nr:flagellar protein FlaG [Bacillota bacterium]